MCRFCLLTLNILLQGLCIHRWGSSPASPALSSLSSSSLPMCRSVGSSSCFLAVVTRIYRCCPNYSRAHPLTDRCRDGSCLCNGAGNGRQLWRRINNRQRFWLVLAASISSEIQMPWEPNVPGIWAFCSQQSLGQKANWLLETLLRYLRGKQRRVVCITSHMHISRSWWLNR